MARSKIASAEFAKVVAEAYVAGVSYTEMAEIFDVTKATIGHWCHDPRVQAHAARFAQERVLRITRKIDQEIEGRVGHASEMETELLLKIRKEFLERALKVDLTNTGDQNADTINEAVSALEDNPELAKQLKELVSGGDDAES